MNFPGLQKGKVVPVGGQKPDPARFKVHFINAVFLARGNRVAGKKIHRVFRAKEKRFFGPCRNGGLLVVQVCGQQNGFSRKWTCAQDHQVVSRSGLDHADVGAVEKSRVVFQNSGKPADGLHLIGLSPPIQRGGFMDHNFIRCQPLHPIGECKGPVCGTQGAKGRSALAPMGPTGPPGGCCRGFRQN